MIARTDEVGRDMRRGFRMGEEGRDTHVYLWPVHVDVWQKASKYCKGIILQFKMNNLKKNIWGRGVRRCRWWDWSLNGCS